MKNKLPKDWKWIKLKDVCNNASSNLSLRKLENDNGSYPVYGAKGFIKNISFYHQDNDYISIIKDGAGVGRLKITKGKSSVIGTLQYLLPKENIDIKYLFYFLLGIDFVKYVSGSTIPHIYYRHYKEEEFLFVPRQEQEKIVQVLDATFIKIDQAITLVENNINKLKQLNESVLDEVFKNLKTERQELLVKIAEVKRGKSKHRPRNDKSLYDGKYPLIQTGDVRRADKYITKYNKTYNEVGLAQSKLWKKGTICLSIAANIGDVAILSFDACFPDSVLGIFSENLDTNYLFYFLKSIQKDLDNRSSAVAQKNLSVSKISDILIPVPSSKKQKQISQYLDHIIEKNYKLIQHYQNKLTALQDLKKSVLDSAFKGKLKRVSATKQKEIKVIKFKDLYPDPYVRNQRISQKRKLKRRQVYTTTRIIDLHQKHNQKLGHTKVEKINHAIEYIAQCELGRDPVKNTGGPVDFYYTMQFVEPLAKEKNVFEAIQTEKGYIYNTKENFELFLNLSYQDKNLKPYNVSIDTIINNFLFLSLRETELYITVYTGWNNLIIRKDDISINSIYTESIELWIDKAEKFNITDVENAIKWLKEKNYMPTGYGKEVK